MERRSRSLEEQSTQGIYRLMCADGIKAVNFSEITRSEYTENRSAA